MNKYHQESETLPKIALRETQNKLKSWKKKWKMIKIRKMSQQILFSWPGEWSTITPGKRSSRN